MEAICSKVQGKIETAMNQFNDVNEQLNERLAYQLAFLQDVDW
jgi:urease accessory protein UreF